jgi:hypothetical protein
MKFLLKILIVAISLVMLPNAVLCAAKNTACKPYTEKDLNSIKASNDPNFIIGAGVVSILINPASTIGKELLDIGGRIESTKGVATTSLIVYQLSHDSPLKPFRENIRKLLQDDKDNALPYYLDALLQQEEVGDQEALVQIKKGNAKIFNSYPKQRFYSIVEAAKLAKCGEVRARQYAVSNLPITSTYVKLRHLCQKLVESNGEEARKACFLMGQNLERGSQTCIEKITSLGIQSNSLNDSPSNAAIRMEIKKKREQALACGKRGNGHISESDVTKDADLQYYEIFLKSGEAAAQDFLSDFVKRKR